MVFLTIRSIYPNDTNYNKLLLNYGKNLLGKFMGKSNIFILFYPKVEERSNITN